MTNNGISNIVPNIVLISKWFMANNVLSMKKLFLMNKKRYSFLNYEAIKKYTVIFNNAYILLCIIT